MRITIASGGPRWNDDFGSGEEDGRRRSRGLGKQKVVTMRPSVRAAFAGEMPDRPVPQLQVFRDVARARRIELTIHPIGNPGEIAAAIDAAG